MENTYIATDNCVFVTLSFEGPDIYSLAGGLGVRITNLSQTLAHMGFPTHLFFIGDPNKASEENFSDNLVLHRWCQWISKYHPAGVYQAEQQKLYDYNRYIPMVNLFPTIMVCIGNNLQNTRKAGHALPIFRWKVGAAEERFTVRVQEYSQRPTAAASDRLHRLHINSINIRTFFPVHLNVDEVLIHQAGNIRILEALMRHDVAPVAC